VDPLDKAGACAEENGVEIIEKIDART
jgi:hypothetical protein